VNFTNIASGWFIDGKKLEGDLGIPRVLLVNGMPKPWGAVWPAGVWCAAVCTIFGSVDQNAVSAACVGGLL
jgi:hypothetical protein